MPKRLSDEGRQYIIRNCEKSISVSKMAKDLNVFPGHLRRLWARHQKTGDMHRPRQTQRLHYRSSNPVVTGAYEKQPVGAVRIAKDLRKNHDTSYNLVYLILKKNGVVTASAEKSKRHKWVRYERMYSNAMWHTDWHTMKDPRFYDYSLITYIDDASRCVTGAALFENATSENT